MQWDIVKLPRMEWENVKPAPGRLVVVQRFVNTRTYLTGDDLLVDAEEATAWLTEHGLLGAGERLDEAGRRRLLAFREVLRGLLVTHNGGAGADVKALNDLVASPP
jgi:Putative stress-induced transcription regulator